MSAGTYDFTIEQGSDFGPRSFTWRDENAAPIDLTGWTIVLTAAATRGQGRIDLSTEDASPVLHLDDDPTTGRFWLNIPAATTATYAPGRYVYNVEAQGPTAKKRLLKGTITVDPEVPEP